MIYQKYSPTRLDTNYHGKESDEGKTSAKS